MIETMEVLLLIAAFISMAARRLKLPYTVGLTVGGLALAMLPHPPEIPLTKNLIFNALLPPLVFEASVQIDFRKLRRDLGLITFLATAGVLAGAAIVATGCRILLGWDWGPSVVFAVLISATDPVAVIATFKGLKMHGRLPLLVESESLFNDGTAAVLFAIALSFAAGAPVSIASVVQGFAVTTVGGALAGLLVGGAVLLAAGRTEDHLVEIALTTVVAYGSFLLAEHFHLSGVLATVAAGMLVGNVGMDRVLTQQGQDAVLSFWEFVAFVANSVVFLMIGVTVTRLPLLDLGAGTLTILAIVLVARAVTVYAGCLPFAWSPSKVDFKSQHILFWAGLRGALALALVIGLPKDFPQRQPIVLATFAVVAFSVIVQGLTIGPLLKRLGLSPSQHTP